MNHEQLLKNTQRALEHLFADITVPPETTRESLKTIIEDCKMKLDGLRSDAHED